MEIVVYEAWLNVGESNGKKRVCLRKKRVRLRDMRVWLRKKRVRLRDMRVWLRKKASVVKEIFMQLLTCIINVNKKSYFCVNKIFGQVDLIFGTK